MAFGWSGGDPEVRRAWRLWIGLGAFVGLCSGLLAFANGTWLHDRAPRATTASGAIVDALIAGDGRGHVVGIVNAAGYEEI
jgi:hypothetical protein